MRARRAVRADRRRGAVRQRGGRPARPVGRDQPRRGRALGRRPDGGEGRLPPRLPGRRARPRAAPTSSGRSGSPRAPTRRSMRTSSPSRRMPGKLALQYWFFYVFNDFNNKHEGDWEMIQLLFDADDAAEALAAEPAEVGYSQHEGAERADWGDDKLELVDGTHPVVYPAAGSHANYFESALFLGRSAEQGVGCDDTNGPSRELRPAVAFVPTDRADYLADVPVARLRGPLGRAAAAFYNGPTGPNLKTQWTTPISWAEEAGATRPSRSRRRCTSGRTRRISSAAPSPPAPTCSPSDTRNRCSVVLASPCWSCSSSGRRPRTTWNPSAPLRLAPPPRLGPDRLGVAAHVHGPPAPFVRLIGRVFVPLCSSSPSLQYAGLPVLLLGAARRRRRRVEPGRRQRSSSRSASCSPCRPDRRPGGDRARDGEIDAGRPDTALGAYARCSGDCGGCSAALVARRS